MPISLRLRVLARHARRLIGGPATLESAAFRHDIVEPATTVDVSPAIYLDGQLEKIISTSNGTTVPFQIETATGLRANHAATIAYHIRNATLLNGSFYAGRLRHVVADAERCGQSDIKHLNNAAVTSSLTGTRFFGHWLTDDCPTHLLASQYAMPLCLNHPYNDLAGYARYYQQDWSPTDFARIEKLIVFQDFGQGKNRQRRYEVLHERLATHFPLPTKSSLVYLRRGSTGVSRLIKNENQILDDMIKRGFVVADIFSDSLGEIIEKLMRARVVVSIEGSQVAHCCAAMRKNNGLVILSLPTVFNGVHRGWAEARAIRYGFVVGSAVEGGFTFNASEILLTVEKMLSALG